MRHKPIPWYRSLGSMRLEPVENLQALQDGYERLTRTERKVFYLIANGLSHKEIATRRGVKRITIDTEANAVLETLDLHTNARLVRAWHALKEAADEEVAKKQGEICSIGPPHSTNSYKRIPWYQSLGSMRLEPVENLQALQDRYKFLTPQERRVFYLIANGLNREEIATRHEVEARTVNSQYDAIASKLGVHGNSRLMRAWYALKEAADKELVKEQQTTPASGAAENGFPTETRAGTTLSFVARFAQTEDPVGAYNHLAPREATRYR